MYWAQRGGNNSEDLHFGYRNGNTATLAHWGNDIDLGVNNWNFGGSTAYLLSGEYDGNSRVIEEFRDGYFNTNSDNNTSDLTGSRTNYIGDLGSVRELQWQHYRSGGLLTMISQCWEKLQIYSDFALKYGFMLTNDNDDDGNLNEVISGSVREGDLVASRWDYLAVGLCRHGSCLF
ncbi:MAG: hypothetical protein U5L96_08015 [Owenweeksia sp.]|nr:hypothetical protein [Owenweeksia sp.]